MSRKLYTEANFAGRVFTRLTVLRSAETINRCRRWVCQCACGIERVVYQCGLTSGDSQSCGCLNREISRSQKNRLTHGMADTGIYFSWQGVKSRCFNTKRKDYKDYGGRGITMQRSWLKFDNFLRDMGDTWKQGMTIERKEVNKGYTKDNCLWVRRARQPCNMRRTVWVQYKGHTMCCADAARLSGLSYNMLQRRIKNGWPQSLLFQESRRVKSN